MMKGAVHTEGPVSSAVPALELAEKFDRQDVGRRKSSSR